MKIRKRRLSNLLAVVLVVSSLTPQGMMVSASAAESSSVYQEGETKLQETLIATKPNAEKQNTKTKMLESRSGTERAATTSGTCGENLTWVLKNGVLTISGTGEMENWYRSYGLTEAPWYDNKDEIISVVISDGVTSIGNSAFYGCSNLTSVEIPTSVTSIGNYAFRGCSNLTSVEIPTNVTSIGEDAFYDCSSLTSVKIPTSVTSIRDSAFYDCSSLTSVEIPTGVTSIGDYAFRGCSSLTSVKIPTSVTSIGNYAFNGCSNLTSVEIPTSVTSIGGGAFYHCSSLTSVEIPTSVTSIEHSTFSHCSSLTSVEIPTSVTSIGDDAFNGCSNLTSVKIPTGVTSIGNYAFSDCSSLTSVEIPTSVTSIGDDAFRGCSSLTSVKIPTGVTSIGDDAFYGCSSLTSVKIPTGVTSIGDDTFYGCRSLTSVKIPTSVTSIGDDAFYIYSVLSDVYYEGGKSDWVNITIGKNNESLTSANIHYNSIGSNEVTDPGNVSINIESLGDAVLYVPYSAFLKLDNTPEGSQPTFRISDGTLPEGLELNESTGEISGMPTKAGEFKITIEAVFSESQDVSVSAEATIKVKENTDVNIDNSSDEGYEVLQYVGNKTEQGYVMTQYTDQTFVSSGDFGEFIALWLNGQKLIEDEDYTKEEGSTRITIRSQTFKTKTRPGSNTLSAAFKNKKNQLKRTSQNFIVDVPKKDDTGTSAGNGSGSSNNGSSSSSSSRKSRHRTDGRVAVDKTDINLYNDDSWVKDEIGWRCKMPDGNWITNTWFRLPYQGTVEWYYFNEQGYMATGLFEKNGLLYYLNPISDGTQGKMITGWKMIDGKWYYFKEIDDGTRGAMMSDVWIGEYYINSQGVWEE